MQDSGCLVAIYLEFNLAAESDMANNFGCFETADELEAYVKAEAVACRPEYERLARAFSKEKRLLAKRELDKARWAFFETWRAKDYLGQKSA